jgi:beta-xylosidase
VLAFGMLLVGAVRAGDALWTPDRRDGTFRNPILYADYSDPDAIRVGEDFYLTASSFNCMPGLPILHSRDLVNWTIVAHALERLDLPGYDAPAHGRGIWAPSLRYHDGRFWIVVSTPDEGILMLQARDARGPWSKPVFIKEAKGWIDPCPFWDDDGSAYLVHAFAKSRAGINSVLCLHRMKPDATGLTDEGTIIFDGHASHPTIEGPKMYKRNGYYYIFAPAGGAALGWQTVLRSRSVFGPYEDRIVLRQGKTMVNGPHQGAWVETQRGESWFLHFQDHGAFGRIGHLQPMRWVDDWPVMGEDLDGDGVGEPVMAWKKPDVGPSASPAAPQASDEFEQERLGLQWQWHANPRPEWASLTARPGWLRLSAQACPGGDLEQAGNVLAQKLQAPPYCATTRVTWVPRADRERAGLVVTGDEYASLGLTRRDDATVVTLVVGDQEKASLPLSGNSAVLRVCVDENGICRFSVSADGAEFLRIGEPITAKQELWIGAKVGLFAARDESSAWGGYADFDWLRISFP